MMHARIAVLTVLLLAALVPSALADSCSVQHPLSPPDTSFSGQCPNCGMVRAMWARTWMSFDALDGATESCSFHCLGDMALKSGETPKNVTVALYMDPKETIPADKAVFVVGSKAAGTMSPTSKIAFPSKSEAEKYASSCGGDVVSFGTALELAKAGIVKENAMITQRRIKKGKIVEPQDKTDRCVVCGMYPANYPFNKAQVQTRDKEVYHFCSTQCMFTFLEDSAKYASQKVAPFLIWVVDHPTGNWISGRTAYYVVGSAKAFGPMGYEAFPFSGKMNAESFVARNGGKVVIFDGVTTAKIMPYKD